MKNILKKIIVKKAAIVVILVKNMGTNKEFMVVSTAVLTSSFSRISLKNLVTTCTPSELAIVNNIIGIDTWFKVK